MAASDNAGKTLDEFIAIEVRKLGRSASVTLTPDPQPEPLFSPIISVDDHALEPPNLFEGRLPSAMRDRVPYLETDDVGLQWWVIDDVRVPILMGNASAGRDPREWSASGVTYDEVRPATWDAKARVHDMDLMGVWAQLCFGSLIWGFAGWRFSRQPDQAFGLACMRAYNDWMLEVWCGAAPDRYIPTQLPWLADPVIAAAEIRRNAGRGFKAVSFSENPEPLGFPNIYDRSWDPFFAACQETGTVVNLHVGSSSAVQRPCSSSAVDVVVALFPISGLQAMVDWIYAEVPTRFPGLIIALSEAGCSWVPMAIERLDRAKRHDLGGGWPGRDMTAIELVRRNFMFTSIEDPSAFQRLDLIGEDNVMIETDYPHVDGTWPSCQSMIRSQLQHLPGDVVRKVCLENAARVYDVPLPPDEWVAARRAAAS
ncbi:MAG TPA: amidohydrolase family protein [Acidimicrobiales bacterium]